MNDTSKDLNVISELKRQSHSHRSKRKTTSKERRMSENVSV
jgi:hypothetical protein